MVRRRHSRILVPVFWLAACRACNAQWGTRRLWWRPLAIPEVRSPPRSMVALGLKSSSFFRAVVCRPVRNSSSPAGVAMCAASRWMAHSTIANVLPRRRLPTRNCVRPASSPPRTASTSADCCRRSRTTLRPVWTLPAVPRVRPRSSCQAAISATRSRVSGPARWDCRSRRSCWRTTQIEPFPTSSRVACGHHARASSRWPRPWTWAIRATLSACGRGCQTL